jgi:hypothetical protein
VFSGVENEIPICLRAVLSILEKALSSFPFSRFADADSPESRAQGFFRHHDILNLFCVVVVFRKRVVIEPMNLRLNFPWRKQANGILDRMVISKRLRERWICNINAEALTTNISQICYKMEPIA